MKRTKERDLWWESRQRTRKGWKGFRNLFGDSLFKIQTLSLRGRPTIESFLPTALAQRSDIVWFPDLNKYRPYSLKPYFDAGCKAAMVRIGGVGSWTMELWNYIIDSAFRAQMEEADRLGVLGQIIGYWVHNPFEYRTVDSNGLTIQTKWIDQFTAGGYMPKSLAFDHEIEKCWLSNGAEFHCTAVNEVESLRVNTINAQQKFNKPTIPVYSAKWFMNLTAQFWEYHYTHFANVNRPPEEGGIGITRPLMMAWYGQTLSKVYTNVGDVSTDLFNPTPEQIGNYLYCGFQANSWQFTDRLNINGKVTDFNISLDPSGDFYRYYGLTNPSVPEPEPEPEPTGDFVTHTEFGALESQVADMATQMAKLGGHKHDIGSPILV